MHLPTIKDIDNLFQNHQKRIHKMSYDEIMAYVYFLQRYINSNDLQGSIYSKRLSFLNTEAIYKANNQHFNNVSDTIN